MKAAILLVEDNPITRKLVTFTLERKGYEVINAATGEAALAALDVRKPDLVLQDLVLPDVDGFELGARLRERLHAAPVPHLAFTSVVSAFDESRIVGQGFDDVIVKPVDPARLIEIVQSYLPVHPAPEIERFGDGRTLLVVDDDALQLKLAQLHFGRLGFVVVVAADGVEALRLARAQKPNAILTDVLMPRLDGFGLCLELRRDESLRDVPVVLTTSTYVDEADRRLAEQAGATGYVVRTPSFDEVIAAVRRALAANASAPEALAPDSELTLEKEHAARVVRQLERQVVSGIGASQRSAILASELAIVSGISTALAHGEPISEVLENALAMFLDATALSAGIILVFSGDGATARAFGHAGRWDDEQVASFCRDCGELRSLLATGTVLSFEDLTPEQLARARAVLARDGAVHGHIVPMSFRGELLGAFLLGSNDRSGDALDARRLAFAQTMCAQVGQGLALVRAFEKRIEAERVALKSSAAMRAIMESSGVGIAAVGSDGQLLFANVTAHALFRLGDTDTVALDRWVEHYGLFRPDRVTPFELDRLPMVRAMQGEAVDAEEAFIRHAGLPNGMSLSITARPLVDESGQPGGAVAVFRDITAEKAAQEQLMASDRMASLGTLAAGVAHEINNPILVVVSNLELALEALGQLEVVHGGSVALTELRGSLRDAREGAELAREIAKDLKLFSRAEEDRRSPVNLRRVLESTLRMAYSEVRHRARLVKLYGNDVPEADANESRLGQVFLNLVINAAQAIPEGDADRNEITIRTSCVDTEAGRRVLVEVKDTGPGIPPETLRRLFTPFFTTKPKGVGTGLGLAICQRIVTGIGGSIAVESVVGVGTTFKVFLPVAQREEASAPAPVTLSTSTSTSAPAPAPAPARRGKILIIDDEPLVAAALRRSLARAHDVTALDKAADALALVEGGARFDLILCDVMMPALGGPQFFQRLLALASEQAERVVFMTGGAFTHEARDFLARVPNLRFEKPFPMQNLIALVNERVR